MKRNIVSLFFLCLLSSVLCVPSISGKASLDGTSKTTLVNAQSPFSSVSPELISNFRVDRTYARPAGKHGAFQTVLFGSHSTNKSGLARYFLPHGKECLVIAEDSLLDNFEKKKDLLAQNFNIFTKEGTFKSEISIAPKQTFVGLGFHWRECFLHNIFTGQGIWVSASAPLVYVKNNVHLQENVFNNGGGPDEAANTVVVANMIQALNQSDWKYGKIKNSSMHTTQLADIELKIGYDEWLEDESSYVELYVGLIIPTSNKHKGEYLFEPIAGRDRHAGVMWGGSFSKDLLVNQAGDKYLQWDVSLYGEYLFRNKQMRSLDLVDKPWSRYLPLYLNVEQAQQASDDSLANLAVPGINLLTQKVVVTPGFNSDMNSALVYRFGKMEAEFGYNLFFKRAESVKLDCPWNVGPAIKYVDGLGQTNPIRDITGNKYFEQKVFNNGDVPLVPVVLQDFAQSLIMQEDLDLDSAATPALFSHTLYATFGYHVNDKKYPIVASGGLSYTFAQNNAVVNNWMMWVKGAFSF